MNFYVGQKVVCIVDFEYRDNEAALGVVMPKYGEIYTIRELCVEIDYIENVPALRLREIVNPEVGYWNGAVRKEICFGRINFRPLIETDISIFETIRRDSSRERKLKPLVTEDA